MANSTPENKERKVQATPDISHLTGAALISNTSVCEVSRLLVEQEPSNRQKYSQWDQSDKDQLRVIDLFSLIEAVVLHEHLYTLPCTPSGDVAQLSLRNELISAGVLQELDTRQDHPDIADLVYTFACWLRTC